MVSITPSTSPACTRAPSSAAKVSTLPEASALTVTSVASNVPVASKSFLLPHDVAQSATTVNTVRPAINSLLDRFTVRPQLTLLLDLFAFISVVYCVFQFVCFLQQFYLMKRLRRLRCAFIGNGLQQFGRADSAVFVLGFCRLAHRPS